jgi:hypothetical protein
MLLKDKESGTLVEIADVQALINPSKDKVPAQDQAGQEEQDVMSYTKEQLIFPSGEELPRCWKDANYKASK